MTQHDEIADALALVLQAFQKFGIEYRVGGSVASSVWGRARSTLDIDLVADIPVSQASPFCQFIETDYYVDESAVREAILRNRSFNIIHLATMVKVDVFILAQTPFDQASFQRHAKDFLGSLADVCFCTAEDMILRKLDWYRKGGEVSTKQWDDILGILEVQQHSLDNDYLTRWAADLGLADLLVRAREECFNLE